jgi:hypothetical protein
MRFKRPSPAMVVACVALFVALGGTSVAAVNYARNAGKVDGKSAYKASRSTNKVAGGLVATYPGGALKGRLAHRFLAETPLARPFGRAFDVVDNAASAPVSVVDTGRLGDLTATCTDQAAKPGIEDPESTISFVNRSGTVVNVAKRIGANPAQVGTQQNGTVAPVVIRGSNTFEFNLNQGGADVLIEGVVRQDGARTGGASCLVYGSALQTGS